MDGTNMKKILLLFTVFLLFFNNIYSFEIRKLSERNIILKNQRVFPELYYFGNNMMLSDMKLIGNHDIIPIFDDEKDFCSKGINPFGYTILNKIYFNSNFDKFYYVVTNPEEKQILIIYEISIHENDTVEKHELSISQFEILKPHLIQFERIFKKQLLNNYFYKGDFEKKFGKWYPYFIISDSEKKAVFDFRNYSQEFVNGVFAINNKGNRISYITEDKESYVDDYHKKYLLHELAIIYDAVCNDDKVRVRTEPNLNCDTVCLINKNDAVKIKDQSDRKFEIDGEKWYWHQVETSDGKTGWVYGKYLDIEN